MYIKEIRNILTKYNIAFAVIADISTNYIRIIGEKQESFFWLYNSLFSELSIEALNKSLDGKIMPQIDSIGDVICILYKPSINTIVGLFYRERVRDAVEQFHWSKKIEKEIKKIWNKRNSFQKSIVKQISNNFQYDMGINQEKPSIDTDVANLLREIGLDPKKDS